MFKIYNNIYIMAFMASITNVGILLSTLAPLLISFFLVMGSVIDLNLKGLIYLAGILISSLINLFLNRLPWWPQPAGAIDPNCNLINFSWAPDNRSNIPAYNSMFLTFTTAYLMTPMILTKQINPALITFLGIFYALDIATSLIRGCAYPLGIALGSLVGTGLGIGWAMLFYKTGHGDLLYFNELISNNVICSRPKKQTFKCAIYKDGELVKNL